MTDKCDRCGCEIKEDVKFCPECGDEIRYPQARIYCTSCGAEITHTEKYCENCGKAIEEPGKKRVYCSNCGADITNGENFCEDCGTRLNFPKEQKRFIEKYKLPIIIVILAAVIIFAGLIVLNSQESEPVEPPSTQVTVGSLFFEIPGKFAINSSLPDIQSEGGVFSTSQSFSDGYDYIYIGVITGGYAADLESVAASEGGVRKNLMGYDGYYSENDIGDYTFTFVAHNKICLIGVSSPYLFDEIEVL